MSEYTPDFRIINAESGKDLTPDLKPYFSSLSLTESSDSSNDTLTITLSGDGIQSFPASGTVLSLQIGYLETGLVEFGHYKVDTKTLKGMPMQITVKAGATDFNAEYKSQKSRSWDMVFLSDVLDHIAKANGLDLVVDDLYRNTMVEYIEQSEESDMNFIARIAKEYGAEGTIKGGKLAFKEKGIPAKVITVDPGKLESFSFTWFDKPSYDCYVATWHDRNSLVSNEEVFDGENFLDKPFGRVLRVKSPSESQYQARKKAKAKYKSSNAETFSATLKMKGNTSMVSKVGLKIDGFFPDVDGEILYINRVTHSIGKNGYSTQLTAESPDYSK